ncbi:hypothetical protein EZS27_043684, partial [termite gut metagenome]
MKSQKNFIKTGLGIVLLGIGLSTTNAAALNLPDNISLAQDNTYVAKNIPSYKINRPEVSKRLFTSKAVENEIVRIKKLLRNQKLAWMFENCFPNTLDTTVYYRLIDGKPDTFVYTGDIHAMWLRDSGA